MFGCEALFAARKREAFSYSRAARSRAAVASSTEAKLALPVATGVDPAEGGVASVVVTELSRVVGSSIVARPIAIPPISNSTAAAACIQGRLDAQPREDSRMRPSSRAL